MPKLSFFFFLSLSVFLLFIQTDSEKSELKKVQPTEFSKLLYQLELQREKLSSEFVLVEVESLEQKIQSGSISSNSEELIRFYAIFLEILGENYQAEKGIDIALNFQKKINPESLDSESWADFFANLGLLYDAAGQTLKAVQAYERAVQAYESQQIVDYPALANTLKNLGYAYFNLNFENKTLVNYYKALDIAKDHAYSDFEEMTSFVFNLFYMEYEYGNEQGMSDLIDFFDTYIEEAERSDTLSLDQINVMKINQYLNKARYYEAKRDAEKTIEIVATMENFMEGLDDEFRNQHQDYQLSLYESAGTVFKNLERFEESKEYYDRMQRVPMSDFYQMKYTANLGMLYYFAQDYPKSLSFADKSLDKLDEMGYKGSSVQTLMVLKAELLSKLGRQSDAKKLIIGIYSSLLSRELTEQELAGLNYGEFKGANSNRFISIFIRSGNVYREFFKETNRKEDFDRAYNFYRLAAEMFQQYYLKGTYNSWLESLNKEIEGGVLSMLLDAKLSPADSIISSINLLEQNASQQLWKRFVSKNEELLGKTAEMITGVNLKQLELELLPEGDSLQSEKRELELALEKIEQEIASERTFEFYSDRDFDLVEFQKSMPKEEQVLKFYVTDMEVFGVLISSDSILVRQLGAVKDLEEKVSQLRTSILEIGTDYTAFSKDLYQKLLSPFPFEKGKRLQIIPDDFLYLLPFEVLSPNGGDFLIQETPIAYQHSFKLLNYSNPIESRFNPDFLIGFAPSYEGTQFSAIQNNLKETERIVAFHSGEAKVGQEASKRNFVASLANYRVHHLAMHTEQQESNFDQSALVFANAERLKLDELYKMNFPSELVVLSACNTGVGQLQPGEGLSSLSRALTFAGVKSSVYSLWEVPDKETAELMIFFYEEIKNGLPKDQALAQAKRRFLEENPLKSHPIFWAGFVINGQLDPIQTSVFPTWLGFLGLLLVGGLTFFFWNKKRKK